MDFLKNKQGEMTAKMLVSVIVLALGFIILLIIYSQFLFQQEVDKEICHESVLARHTFNYGPFETGRTVIPLKCKTEKICFTQGEECTALGRSNEENVITEIDVSKDVVRAKSEVLDTIANSMYDCHSMLGEGKLNFVPRTTFENDYCLICSRFAFDEKLRQSAENITYGELYRYLQLKKNPEGQTYLEYLYPGWKDWSQSKTLFENIKKSSPEESIFKQMSFEDWKILPILDQGYSIIAQITPAKTIWGKIGTASAAIGTAVAGAVVTVVGVALIPVSGPVGAGIAAIGVKVVVAGGVAGTVASTIAVGGATYWYTHDSDAKFEYSPPTVYPYDADSLRALGCETFLTAP